jgi:hypothetical protein
LEKDYLYEQLYDGLKMEGAIIFTEFDFSEFGFSKLAVCLKGFER